MRPCGSGIGRTEIYIDEKGKEWINMNIGFIGSAGHWGYALKQVNNHKVAGIAPGHPGENMEGMKKSLSDLGVEVVAYENYMDLLAQIEVAVVASRPDLNASITEECLKRDIYVFSEKPLAITMEQLDKLREVQKNSKAFVSAMFGMRCLPWFRTMKEALPAIGTIRLLNGQKSYKLRTRPDYYKKQETFGGIIPWVAIHALDWIYAMTGLSVNRIDAMTNNEYNRDHGDLEMTSICMFELEGGVLASVSADFYRPVPAKTHGDDRLRIVGTEGVLESIDGVVKLIDKDGERELPLLAAEDVFEQFLRRTKGEDVGVSSEDSFYMTEVALKAEASALKKKENISK